MATGQFSGVIESLRRTALLRDEGGLTEGQLLEAFLVHADEAAFEALLHRLGPMVWGVCLRVLGATHDAEDAFQAAFLVLVRKADAIRPREMVGPWLYSVAYRTALKAKAVAARRRAREKQVQDMPAKEVHDAELWSDLRPLLDRELSRLADKYREPLILCDLEGKSQRQAAQQLGWPAGTLMTRLTRARRLLARRLTRQGIALAGSTLALTLAQNAAAAQAPAALIVSTVQAAAQCAAGQAATGVSASVAALTQGVIQAMFLHKIKNVLLIVLTLTLVGSGVGLLTQRVLAGRPRESRPIDLDSFLVATGERGEVRQAAERALGQRREGGQRQEVRGIVKSVDSTSATITIILPASRRETVPVEHTYSLSKQVEVVVGGGARLGGLFKEAQFADLSEGIVVGLLLATDQKTVEGIVAEQPTVHGLLKALDAKKRSLTVSFARGRDTGDPDKTLVVAEDAEITLDDGRGRRYSLREGKLDDLSEGALVTLRLSLDKKQVQGIQAEGATISGTLKALDAATRSLTVSVRPPRGDDAGEERVVPIAKDALVLIDDGRGRLLSVKEVKLAEVPVGTLVMVKLAADQGFAMQLRAEGPAVTGLLKAVDADKGAITIAIPRGRDDAEQKTFALAKDARVTFDGAETRLGELKVGENGPVVTLRLTLDQRAVQALSARQPGSR
jgi:RNA polymerase sigma factor (sigma-70 family)